MNNCKICGQPSGIYDICRECQKDIKDGKVNLCNECGSYFITANGFNCKIKKDTSKETPKEQTQEHNINIEVNTSEEKDGCMSWFGKGFSGGCGCLIAIILGIAIILLIGISQFL